MIYLDTSVCLAYLLAEDRSPADSLWGETLVSSRLLEYEIWTRIHARGLATSHGEQVRDAVARIGFLELNPVILARALEPFPVPVRTLDALHLASLDFLLRLGRPVRQATYDQRMASAALALGVSLY